MKQFNLNKNEKILSSQKGSKQYIVMHSIITIAMAVIAIVLISNISNIGQIYDAIGKAIFITLSITLFCLYLNEIIKTVTTRVILTDQRLVYMQSGINAKNVEIPVNQIKDLYYQKDSIIDDDSTGEITVIKKNDFYEELPNVKNAFDIEKNFTQHIVNQALNENK